MNRRQFAETVAQAYMDQWHPQEWRRSPVMNEPAIDYDPESGTFSSCSTLTPTTGDEIRVLELSDGMFGSERPRKVDIVYFLTHTGGNDLWHEVCACIEDNTQA